MAVMEWASSANLMFEKKHYQLNQNNSMFIGWLRQISMFCMQALLAMKPILADFFRKPKEHILRLNVKL